ncbi:serine/threonine-protein phosphatase [Streptomyces sp. AJS327]|uniref:PP2C family protein-serine/threonine phosphatase n=1 Tax=Streptomyces sp. AJS327 TaxID=2545265 RepID=UPI0015DE7429|nr:PP2C family protein-serine/threonine phosphatase [Streptomyces sp. AJS327]MBA0052720.1 serine/threonine-protein phosphatase [Streptomyces sp. AJS327]
MTSPHMPKVAGFEPSPASSSEAATPVPSSSDASPGTVTAERDELHHRLADLRLLHERTERLARTTTLDGALRELLHGGAALLGARRGLLTLVPGLHGASGAAPAHHPADPVTSGAGAAPLAGHPADGAWPAFPGLRPGRTVGLGLGPADLGELETVPHHSGWPASQAASPAPGAPPAEPSEPPGSAAPLAHPAPDGEPPDPTPTAGHPAPDTPAPSGAPGVPSGTPGVPPGAGRPEHSRAEGEFDAVPHPLAGIAHPDIAADHTLDPLHRAVAARLGYAASYAAPLATSEEADGTPSTLLGTAVWLYDQPAEPSPGQRLLLDQYLRFAAAHTARELARSGAERARRELHAELLPGGLPRLPDVTLAARRRPGPDGGAWYDALPLPDGALGLAVGGVTGDGAATTATLSRLRSALRAYAVLEGEDPVAVLSDLEVLLRLTEPGRTATALFAFAEPAARRVRLAGAGHCPPLVTGERRTEYVETTVSAPLNMLACWEAPSAQLTLREGETLLLYSDGLLRRTGDPVDLAFARLRSTVAAAPDEVRADPEALVDHVLRELLPEAPVERATGNTGTSEDTGAAGESADRAEHHVPGSVPGAAGRARPANAEVADAVLLAVRF